MELKQLIMDRPAWLNCEPDAGERVILNTRLDFKRNLAKFPFPSKASLQQKAEIYKEVTGAIESAAVLGEAPLVINLTEVSDIAKTLLFERDYVTLPVIHASGERGIAINETGTIILINGENHIQISQNCPSNSVTSHWEELNLKDTLLGKELTYAFDPAKGFLLNRPDQCGTGLSVSYTLHLPGLVHTETLEQVLSASAQLGMSGEGKFRTGSDSWGSLFTITGGSFAGSSEEEILRNTENAIQEIVTRELEAREKLFQEAFAEMEDKIWRSYGILRYCRMLSVPQLLNLTSTLRLGVEWGLSIDGLTLSHIDAMIASALQGSVALLMEKEAQNSDELDIQRAEVVRTVLEA